MEEKTYTIAGTSQFEGVTTYRFATGSTIKRASVLKRNGHDDVVFWELPRPMVLKDALAWLRAKGVMAQLPVGQRRGPNGKMLTAAAVPVLEQLDAHVVAHAAWVEAEAQRKADFVARMAAARAAKKAAKEAVAA